ADPAADAHDDDIEAEADAKEYEWSLAPPNAVGNRFQIMHSHARGGIGVVSVAFDSELQREVALKQIKAESADDPDSRSRFLLEAEVTGPGRRTPGRRRERFLDVRAGRSPRLP